MQCAMTLRVIQFAPLPIGVVADAHMPDKAGLAAFERTTSSDQQYDHLRSGLADVAVTAMDNVFAWNRWDPDLDFRVIAQVEQTTELVLVARKGIESIDELRNRRLLVDAPGNGFVVALRALLAAAGLFGTDYRLISAGGVTERLDALLAGKGDATLLGPPFDTKALQQGCRNLGRINEVWPAFPGQGLVVSRRCLADVGPKLHAWLSHITLARRWAKACAQEAALLLEQAGVPVGVTGKMLAAIPSSWVPSVEGINLLLQQRSLVDPESQRLTCDDLVDSKLVQDIEAGRSAGNGIL
jgi:ABC-type nitrate/sulfonate/bicarbonate transport system substrate-binding protein